MSVSLQKGQKVELKKETGGALSNVMVGLGWDEATPEKGGFFKSMFSATDDIDCDASAILCKNGKFVSSTDLVYFGNLRHRSGAVQHMGDNLTGAGEGDDEQIMVNLQQLPAEYDKIIFVVNIFEAQSRHQHFGMISNCFIRICDDNGKEMCRYDLSEHYDNMTAMIFGELYRHNGAWKFNAIGQATTDNSVRLLAERFK
ncbi:MAG: TerD family protein [Oscillospiraceae bacterium]|nr:TerD family protein [Oscillospiraceae bacterium]